MRVKNPVGELTLFDSGGGRKYLCAKELPRFLDAAQRADPEIRLFCQLLAFTGCRLSEALAITPAQLDIDTGRVVFRTLKRRGTAFRAIPVPPELIKGLRELAVGCGLNERIWRHCRQTAWRRVKAVMAAGGITGSQASPKGLRHGFGIANAENNVPMTTTRNWLGHASLETTAIYQQAVGREEHAFAQRLWRKWGSATISIRPASKGTT